MAPPISGTSSASSSLQISGSDENLQHVMDQRKRKRMLSNRESARRSRMRKQEYLDDLIAQATQLRSENDHILTKINVVREVYFNVESENSVLRAQMSELNHKLLALDDIIINCINSNRTAAAGFEIEDYGDLDQMIFEGHDFLDTWEF